MTKLLFNGFREVKNKLNQFNDKYNEFKFGLSLISQKRYNKMAKLIILSSSVVTTGLYFSVNTLFINRYKSLFYMYSDSGDYMKLDPDLEQLAKNVWFECNQKLNKSEDLIEFFPSLGSEPIKLGSLGLFSGALIGIPFNFTYNTVDDVKTIKVRFIGEHNPYAKWRSESGQLFIKCLVLSEDAKKFGIARQIYSSNNLFLFIDCLNIFVSTIVSIGLAQELIKRTKLFKTLSSKVSLRILSLFIGINLWLAFNKIIDYYSSLSADKKAINLGDNYLNGAIEYYSKIKARNAAFNDLIEENRTKLFTEEGEIRDILLNRYLLTLEKRINYLKSFKT